MMIEHALRYQAMGWPVFPLHEPVGKQWCSCGDAKCTNQGKHPRTRNGLLDATLDEEIIIGWWGKWPNANIGVVTGPISGIIVMDIDDPDLSPGLVVPPTAVQRTGRAGGNGKHFIFKHPGYHVKNGSGIFPGIDSRADGGYIVAAPSLHLSGNQYEWIVDPQDMPIADAPKWWLDACSEKKVVAKAGPGSVWVEGERNSKMASQIGKWRRDDMDFDAAMIGAQLLNRQKYSPPMDESEVERIVRSIYRYPVLTPEEEELERIGGEMADAILRNYNETKTISLMSSAKENKKLSMPNIMPEFGLIREIADWILRTSMHPWPEIAVAAAVAFMSLVAGRRYKTYTGLTLNVYMSAVLPSGQGKNHSRSCLKQLISACGMNESYGEGIGSGPGLINALVKNPTRLYLLDEFGYMLERVMSEKAQSYEKQIISNLMTLYTNNMQQFKTADLAESKDHHGAQIIDSPFLSIYGSATPDQFFGAFKSRYAASGGMARFLVVYPDSKWVDQQDVNTLEPPPKHIVDKIMEIISQENPSGNLPIDCSPIIIEADQQTKKAWFSIRDSLKDRIMGSEVSGSVYSRVAENCMKLMAIQAISVDHVTPSMDLDQLEWAYNWTLWAADLLMDNYNEKSADTATEGHSKAIEAIIKKTKDEGIKKNALGEAYRKVNRYELSEYIAHLTDSNIIVMVSPKSSGAGRPAAVYVHRTNFDPEKHTII